MVKAQKAANAAFRMEGKYCNQNETILLQYGGMCHTASFLYIRNSTYV